ncbi:hypothetical protein I5L51_08075 [Pseudomonas mendocina]|nr:hypothetical protein [Pseudomonas mendocina]MBH3339064.1 hypothetical protein [Pseudomonas mendocina]
MNAACIVSRTDTRLVFSENKSIFRVNNNNRRVLSCHTVDGCLVLEGARCDYLLVDDETRSEIYIELKGCDLKRAVHQLCASVVELTKSKAMKKKGYVICTRSPLSSTEIQIMQKKF